MISLNSINNELTVVIRATGEATLPQLKKQIIHQINANDNFEIIDNKKCFEEKLQQSYEIALAFNKPFTVFIDADILLRNKTLDKIRSLISKFNIDDSGFGLRLWDRFYNQPKFRGLHVYRTNVISEAINFIPQKGATLRPENYVKIKLKENGYTWRNDITSFVAGIHDFYQKPEDIYYKYLVRSHRSQDDLPKLKSWFLQKLYETDFQIALQAIRDGEKKEKIVNHKSVLLRNSANYNFSGDVVAIPHNIDKIVIRRLLNRYKLNRMFWASL